MTNMVRVNTRISKKHNEFLDRESEQTGLSKSALIQLAVDQYMTQKEGIATLQQLFAKMDSLEEQIKK